MSGAILIVFLLFAIAIPLALWIAIEGETSDPTVVDRAEAERIAKERGGRGKSETDSSGRGNADTAAADECGEEFDWDSRWGTQSTDADSEDRSR